MFLNPLLSLHFVILNKQYLLNHTPTMHAIESKSEILRIKEFLPVLESLRLLLPIVGNRDDEVEVSRNIFHPRPSVKNFIQDTFLAVSPHL